MEGRQMSRLMLFAVVLFQGTLVFCQSTAAPSGSPQLSGKASMGQLGEQWAFGLSNGQPGKTTARPALGSFDCHGLNTTPSQAGAPVDFDHFFSGSCADLKTHVEFLARNESSFSRFPLAVQPHLKGQPIPTQWPNAKSEQIPTQWPNLKLQAINGGSPGLVPDRGSAR
jgi:hypothetical protein